MCYPTSKQLPRRPSHRHPSDVASPTKNPFVIVAIKIHDIEPLKKSGLTNVESFISFLLNGISFVVRSLVSALSFSIVLLCSSVVHVQYGTK